MNQIERIASREWIKSYRAIAGERWAVCMPDGFGGQSRKQGFLHRELALQWAIDQYGKMAMNRGQVQVAYSRQTFAEYADQWLERRKGGFRSASTLRYRELMELHLKPFFGAIQLVDLSKKELRAFLSEKQVAGDLGPKTLQMAARLFKAIIKDAEEEDAMPVSGILAVKLPEAPKSKPKFWTPEQRHRFLLATHNHSDGPLWMVALYTGLRAGEVAGLRWDCVHLEPGSTGNVRGFIEVKRSIEQKTGKLVETTKNGDDRVVPIFPEMAEFLERQTCRVGFVFGNEKPLDTSHWARDVKRISRKLGLPEITFHQMRHTCISWLDFSGLPRRVVSSIAGHRHLQTTDRYSHVSDDMLRIAVEAFNPVKGWAIQQNSNNAEPVQA